MFYSDSNVHITLFIVFKQRQEAVEPGASTLLAGAVGILDRLIPRLVWNKTLARRSSVRFRSSFIRLITDIVYIPASGAGGSASANRATGGAGGDIGSKNK